MCLLRRWLFPQAYWHRRTQWERWAVLANEYGYWQSMLEKAIQQPLPVLDAPRVPLDGQDRTIWRLGPGWKVTICLCR